MTRGLGGHSPSNVAQYLKGIDFPCQKKDLVAHAKKNNAEKEVMEQLEAFPEREYATMAEVMEGFGEASGGKKAGKGQKSGEGSEDMDEEEETEEDEAE